MFCETTTVYSKEVLESPALKRQAKEFVSPTPRQHQDILYILHITLCCSTPFCIPVYSTFSSCAAIWTSCLTSLLLATTLMASFCSASVLSRSKTLTSALNLR